MQAMLRIVQGPTERLISWPGFMRGVTGSRADETARAEEEEVPPFLRVLDIFQSGAEIWTKWRCGIPEGRGVHSLPSPPPST